MELDYIVAGLKLVGTTINSISVNNTIVDVERGARRSFGLNICEPQIEKDDDRLFAQMTIDFEIQIEQSDNQKLEMKLSLDGAFLSTEEMEQGAFEQLVAVNGAAAIIGISRGKIEAMTANIFNSGKVVIPFVNVIDYYKSLE